MPFFHPTTFNLNTSMRKLEKPGRIPAGRPTQQYRVLNFGKQQQHAQMHLPRVCADTTVVVRMTTMMLCYTHRTFAQQARYARYQITKKSSPMSTPIRASSSSCLRWKTGSPSRASPTIVQQVCGYAVCTSMYFVSFTYMYAVHSKLRGDTVVMERIDGMVPNLSMFSNFIH